MHFWLIIFDSWIIELYQNLKKNLKKKRLILYASIVYKSVHMSLLQVFLDGKISLMQNVARQKNVFEFSEQTFTNEKWKMLWAQMTFTDCVTNYETTDTEIII